MAAFRARDESLLASAIACSDTRLQMLH
jgi:hypothetical protein